MGLTSQSTVSKEKQGENAGNACIIHESGYNTRWFERIRNKMGCSRRRAESKQML